MHESCCVIVGAGPNIGLNIARRFAQGGFDIALISRDQSKLEGLSESLNSEGYTAKAFAADAGKENELQSAFSRITQWNDDIGALVYNAAAMISDSVLDITSSSMMDNMALNLGGAICSVNQVLPSMHKRGGGTILITGGGLGLEPYPDWASLS
ncbi:MAG: SDR family NAD(P)-dependent oxidoreductase, partial [Anaerolineaceae bacterium]|nr:SDR family NAD(P)-dependent oxidoreductase [Anaerolineaceae bacterium]